MMTELRIAPNWQGLLQHNGLDSFTALWQLDLPWFEPPNRARGGWSGVCRLELKRPDGGQVAVFLKRQENYRTRTVRHPLRGEATLAREWRNLCRFQAQGVPVPPPIAYAAAQTEGRLQALLLTEALDDFLPLTELLTQWPASWPETATRLQLADDLACVVRQMHARGLQHNCLYPKHIFVKPAAAGFLVRLIDLEKARWTLLGIRTTIRDLDQLNRHTRTCTDAERTQFCQRYFEHWPLQLSRWVLRRIMARSLRKQPLLESKP